jgi:hypothetical protein
MFPDLRPIQHPSDSGRKSSRADGAKLVVRVSVCRFSSNIGDLSPDVSRPASHELTNGVYSIHAPPER